MYFILGRFSESVEGIQILQLEDERDLQEVLQDPPEFMGSPKYRDAEQFGNLLSEMEYQERMYEEPYYWDVGEAVIIRGEVLSHALRKSIATMEPQSADGIRRELTQKE